MTRKELENVLKGMAPVIRGHVQASVINGVLKGMAPVIRDYVATAIQDHDRDRHADLEARLRVLSDRILVLEARPLPAEYQGVGEDE